MTRDLRTVLHTALLLVALLAGCASPVAAPDSQARQVLAPTGTLRVGLYRGSPTSVIQDASGTKGIGFDLGKELARHLGVPFTPVVFPKNSDVLAAVKAGQVDVSFTNASPERLKVMDFSPTVMEVEKGYLVPGAAPIFKSTDLDQPGRRIGVSHGSSTESELANAFQHAVMVPVPTLKDAIAMLASGRLDAFATNKAILFEMSDQLPGSRVLDTRWGLEHFAFAVPKGREMAFDSLRQFVDGLKAQGLVAQAIRNVGLRGTTNSVR